MAAWHFIEIVCNADGCTANARAEHWSTLGVGSVMRGLLKSSGWLVAKGSTASTTRHYCPEHAHEAATGPRPLTGRDWAERCARYADWAREAAFYDRTLKRDGT